MMAKYELLRMGALYIDGAPQMLGPGNRDAAQYPGHGEIDIRNSAPGCTISWVRPTGWDTMIANRNVLFNISWEKMVSIFNPVSSLCPIIIDGWECLCGPLKITQEGGWNDAINAVGSSDKVWHWQDVCSMDAFGTKNGASIKSIMTGKNDPRFRRLLPAEKKENYIGFRPMLELIRPLSFVSGSVISLEGQRFGVKHEDMRPTKTGNVHFKPVLYPLSNSAPRKDRVVDNGLLTGSEGMRAYTLLMDGKPVNQTAAQTPKYKPGAQLELTDHYYGDKYLIPWTFKYGCAYAGKEVLRDISAGELYEQGFV